MKDIIELKELKDYFIDNEITQFFKNISFERYHYLLLILFRLPQPENYPDDEKTCYQLFKYYDKKRVESFLSEKTKESMKNMSRISNFSSIPYYAIMKKNIMPSEKNLVLIQAPSSVIYYSNFIKYFETDFLIFPSEDVGKEEYMEYLDKVEKNNFVNYKYDFVEKKNQLINMTIEKKDTIIVKISHNNLLYYPYSFSQYKIPDWLVTITFSIQNLKVGGNLVLSLTLTNLNPAYIKIIQFLVKYFDHYVYDYEDYLELSFGTMLILKGFKGEIESKDIKRLKEISEESLKYSYSTCDYFDYMYTHPEINFKIDDTLKLKKTSKKLMIINDINLTTVSSKISKNLLFGMKDFFNFQMELIKSHIDNNIYFKNKKLIIKENLVSKEISIKLFWYIRYMYENNIPISKPFLVYIKKFSKEMISIFFDFKKNNNQIKYNISGGSKVIQDFNLDSFQIYTFPELDYQQLSLRNELSLETTTLTAEGLKEIPKKILNIENEYQLGIPEYISKLNIKGIGKISDSFTKLWEIYINYPYLIKNKKQFNVFHFGQDMEEWIKCTDYYINIRKNNSINQNWYLSVKGGGLKEKNKFTKGSVRSGGITISKNIETFKRIFQNKPSLDLITCDTNIETNNITKNQKYEFAKLVMVLSTASKGTNCVIKHKLPYDPEIKESSLSNGFFINMMYIYYYYFDEINFYKPITSNSSSIEFYIIANNFRGINEENYEEFANILRYLKKNVCFYEKNTIPKKFLSEIKNFITEINQKRYLRFQLRNTLITCFVTNDEYLKKEANCDLLLGENYTKNIQPKKFQKWLDIFKLY